MNRNAKPFQTLALATLLIWLGGCASAEKIEEHNLDDELRTDDELRKRFVGARVIRDNSVFGHPVDWRVTPIAAKPLPIATWLTIEGYSGNAYSASFAADGKFLVTGGNDNKGTGNALKIWSAETGEELRAWNAQTDQELRNDRTRSASVSRDGKLAAIANSTDGKVSVRALETGEELYSLLQETDSDEYAKEVAISPNGKYLAGIVAASENAGLNLWAAETGRFIARLDKRARNQVAFSPDSKKIAYDYGEDAIAVLSVETGNAEAIIIIPDSHPKVIRFSADGNLLAAGFSDGRVHIWSLKEGNLLRTFVWSRDGIKFGFGSVTALAFSPDGRLLVSGGSPSPVSNQKDFSLRVWSIPNDELVATLSGHTDDILDLDFSPDGKTIASVSKDKTIKLWKLGGAAPPAPTAPSAPKVSFAPIQTLEGHADDVTALAFSPDGKLLASMSKDNTMRLWSLATGKAIKTVEEKNMGLYGSTPLAFSPDGKYLASSSYDPNEERFCVKLWSVKTGAFARELRELRETIWSISFSPDSKLLAAMSNSAMKIWSVETGKEALETKQMPSSDSKGVSAAFTPDGERIMTNIADDRYWKGNSIKVWSAKTGAELKSINSSGIGAIFVSSDGKYVAVGKTICDMQTGQLVRRTEADIVGQSPNGEFYIGLRKKYNEREQQFEPVETIVMLARTGRGIARIDAQGSGNAAVAISPDGKLIATVDRDGAKIKLWKVSGLEKL